MVHRHPSIVSISFHSDKSNLIWAKALRAIAFTFSGLFVGFEMIDQGFAMSDVFLFYSLSVLFRLIFIAKFSNLLARIDIVTSMQLSLLLFMVFALQRLFIPDANVIALATLALWYGLGNVIYSISATLESAALFSSHKSTSDIGAQRLIVAGFSAITPVIAAYVSTKIGTGINHIIAVILLMIGINMLTFIKNTHSKSEMPKDVSLQAIIKTPMTGANAIGYFARGVSDMSLLIWIMLMFSWGFRLAQIGILAGLGALAAVVAFVIYKKLITKDHNSMGLFRAMHSLDAIGLSAKALPLTLPLAYGLHLTRTVTSEFYMPAADSVVLHNVNCSSNKVLYSIKAIGIANIGKLISMATPLVLLFILEETWALRISILVMGVISLGANLLHFQDDEEHRR